MKRSWIYWRMYHKRPSEPDAPVENPALSGGGIWMRFIVEWRNNRSLPRLVNVAADQ